MTTLLRSTTAITDLTRPRGERHRTLGLEEWRWCFNFIDAWCNRNADGAVTNGVTYLNQARATDNAFTRGAAVARNAGGTFSQVAGRAGLLFPAGTYGVTDFIEIGGAAFDFSAANDNYLAIVWDKQPLAGYNTGTFRPILWDAATNANNSALCIDTGADGRTIRAVWGTGGASVACAAASALGQGAPRQIAVSRIGTQGTLYVNGVQRAQINTVPVTLQSATSVVTKLAHNGTGTIYQSMAMKINAGDPRSPAKIVADDWLYHASAFV